MKSSVRLGFVLAFLPSRSIHQKQAVNYRQLSASTCNVVCLAGVLVFAAVMVLTIVAVGLLDGVLVFAVA